MYCNHCGQEMSDNSKFCSECGAIVAASNEKQTVKEEFVQGKPSKGNKKAGKKLKLWHFIVAGVTVVAIIVSCIVLPKVFSRYDWSEVKLSSILPEPESKWGNLSSNTKEYLYLYVHRTSLDEYDSYVAACVDRGFNIEPETEDSSYIAFNTDGYKLTLYYYQSDKKMTINVDAPMEIQTIQWSTSNIASLLPTPASTLGHIERNDEKGFSIYLGNTSYSEYNTYISECESKGFTVDFQKQDKNFSAKNSDGYQLNVQYKGCNVIYISIIEPQRTLDLSFRSIGSEFEFSVYIDDSWELDVEKGKTKSCNVVLGMGKHTIKVRSDDDWDMYDNYVLSVTKDEKIDFDVNCTQKGIKIDLSGKLEIEYEKEDDVIESESKTDKSSDSNSSNYTTSNKTESTAKNEDDDKNISYKELTDNEINDLAVKTLYKQLLAYENKYHNIHAESCRYKINTIEHDDGQVKVYGVVYFYDKHGSITKFGDGYQRNFTVSMTKYGDVPWCKFD